MSSEPVFAESIMNNVLNPQDKAPPPPLVDVDNTGMNNAIAAGEEAFRQQEEALDAADTQQIPNRRSEWKTAFFGILLVVSILASIGGIAFVASSNNSDAPASVTNPVAEPDTQEMTAGLQEVSSKSETKLKETSEDEITFEVEPEVTLETVNADLDALHAWITNEVYPRMQNLVDRTAALENDAETLKVKLSTAEERLSDYRATTLVLLFAFLVFGIVVVSWLKKLSRRSLALVEELKELRLSSSPGELEDLNDPAQG